MQKNRIPFPDNLHEIAKSSNNPHLLLWVIKTEMPPEFLGIWREVEEAVERIVWPGMRNIIRKAVVVLEDRGKLDWFIEELIGRNEIAKKP
jgi:hypothetical protein